MSRNHMSAPRWAVVILLPGLVLPAEAQQKSADSTKGISQIETAAKRDPFNPKLQVALGLSAGCEGWTFFGGGA
jgi:hypothetical protein